jgi:choline dehydrogenase-like flavoprotein
VLSAGVVGSPRILLNSGIGPAEELKAIGITPEHDLPSVGKNVTEQPSTRFEYLVNAVDTQDTPKRSAEIWQERLDQWKNSKQGPLVNQPINTIGWFRLPEDDPILQKYPDFAAGPTSPHYEIYVWVSMKYLSDKAER